jgi:SAM-dependent methyltransferase
MHERDKRKMFDRYGSRIAQVGHGPAAIGEPKQRQAFYFDCLLQMADIGESDSVLDIGCGYGDLYGYIKSTQAWNGAYVGIDINSDLIAEGRRRYPQADLRVQDIQEKEIDFVADWVICCHALTSDTEGTPFLDHLESMLDIMWRSCRKGLVFNMLSPLADYTNEIHARPPIAEVIARVSKLTNRFNLRHDYMPFEYAVWASKENAIDRGLLIFAEHEEHFNAVTSRWSPPAFSSGDA